MGFDATAVARVLGGQRMLHRRVRTVKDLDEAVRADYSDFTELHPKAPVEVIWNPRLF